MSEPAWSIGDEAALEAIGRGVSQPWVIELLPLLLPDPFYATPDDRRTT
jgi:hypothetical protein